MSQSVPTPTPEEIKAGKVASVQTYMEQTRLLVTLASAFLLAPAGIIGLLKDRSGGGLGTLDIVGFIGAELCFVASVCAGYVVLGTIAGWQAKGLFDVFRPATRRTSLVQIGLYLAGMLIFTGLTLSLATAVPSPTPQKPTLIRIMR